MHDWSRSRIGGNRPGATRQDAQMEVRDMGMSTIQFRPAPPPRAAIVRSHSPNWRSSAKPLPLTLAEFLVSAALVGSVVLAPAWVPVATGAFALLSSAGGSARPKVQLTREGC